MTQPDPARQINRRYAGEEHFQQKCIAAGWPPTKRQASKYRMGRGAVRSAKVVCRETSGPHGGGFGLMLTDFDEVPRCPRHAAMAEEYVLKLAADEAVEDEGDA